MISSQEVNALILQQEQSRAAMGYNPTMAALPGPSTYPPQFSFGGNPNHAGLGNRAASMAVASGAGVPAMLGAATLGAGVAQMLGSRNAAVGAVAALDPFSMAFSGGRAAMGMAGPGAGMAARGIAAGVGGLAGFGVGTAVFGGVQFAANQAVQGYQEQQQINRLLSSNFQFPNMMAHHGFGFSAGQGQQVGSMMRSVDMKDPFMRMRDVTGMLGDVSEMGMMQGVQDVEAFSKKFKSLADTIGKMARMMGTTFKDATQSLGAMRQAGFYSSSDVMGNTRAMQTLGGMGMDQGTFMGMQSHGAGISRSLGMGGRVGAVASRNVAGMVMNAALSGSASAEEIMDMTGAGDLQSGAASLASTVTADFARFFQGGAGRGLLAATGATDKNGRFTGQIDSRRLSEFVSGGASLQDISKMAQPRLGSTAAQASFMTKKEDIAGAIMSDPSGLASIIRAFENTVKEDPRYAGATSDDITQIVTERLFEGDRKKAELVRRIIEEHEKATRDVARRTEQAMTASQLREEIRTKHSIEGLSARVGAVFEDVGTAYIKEPAAARAASLEGGVDRGLDRLFGVSRVQATEGAYSRATQRLTSGQISLGQTYRTGDFGGAARGLAESAGVEKARLALEAAQRGESLDLGTTATADAAIQSLKGNTVFDQRLQGYLSSMRRGEGSTLDEMRVMGSVNDALGFGQSEADLTEAQKLERVRVLQGLGAGGMAREKMLEGANAGGGLYRTQEEAKRQLRLSATTGVGNYLRGASTVGAVGSAGLALLGPEMASRYLGIGYDSELVDDGVGRGLLAQLSGKGNQSIDMAFRAANEAGAGQAGVDAFSNALGLDGKFSEQDLRKVEDWYRTNRGEGFDKMTKAAAFIENDVAATQVAESVRGRLAGRSGLEKTSLADEYAALRSAATGKDLQGAFGAGGKYAAFVRAAGSANASELEGVADPYRQMYSEHGAMFGAVAGLGGAVSVSKLAETMRVSPEEIQRLMKSSGMSLTGDKLSGSSAMKLAEQLAGEQAVGLFGAGATGMALSSGNPQLDTARQVAENSKQISKVSEQIDAVGATLAANSITNTSKGMVGGVLAGGSGSGSQSTGTAKAPGQ